MKTINIQTNGEGFYDITDRVSQVIKDGDFTSGICVLFVQHTSCALTINENYDPSAKNDMESFLKHLAPENLKFITHTAEGPDDSPAHLKSILLNQNLVIPFDKGNLSLGAWQGIFLTEFRKKPHNRKILIKAIS